jgi:hypothetical protein
MRILAYRDFFDLPRAFIVEPKPGLVLFFDCPFDDSIDDYPANYSVFCLPRLDTSDLPDNWAQLNAVKIGPVATIPVSAIHFDGTGRKDALLEGESAIMAAAEREAISV